LCCPAAGNRLARGDDLDRGHLKGLKRLSLPALPESPMGRVDGVDCDACRRTVDDWTAGRLGRVHMHFWGDGREHFHGWLFPRPP
jgi:hypothetical protein